jgi:hypothetical protein
MGSTASGYHYLGGQPSSEGLVLSIEALDPPTLRIDHSVNESITWKSTVFSFWSTGILTQAGTLPLESLHQPLKINLSSYIMVTFNFFYLISSLSLKFRSKWFLPCGEHLCYPFVGKGLSRISQDGTCEDVKKRRNLRLPMQLTYHFTNILSDL